MLQLKASHPPSNSKLLQLASVIKIKAPDDDGENEEALAYLTEQFPQDYISEEEKKAKINPPQPTP